MSQAKFKVLERSEVREAKDGRKYFVLTARPGFGQKQVKRTFWQQFKTVLGLKTKEVYWERASPEEADALIKSGEPMEARKVTHFVEPYPIDGRMQKTYSTMMFPDELDEVSFFANQNHPIMDEDGVIHDPRTKKTPVVNIAPEGTISKVVNTENAENVTAGANTEKQDF